MKREIIKRAFMFLEMLPIRCEKDAERLKGATIRIFSRAEESGMVC